jgi:hypothetical protein
LFGSQPTHPNPSTQVAVRNTTQDPSVYMTGEQKKKLLEYKEIFELQKYNRDVYLSRLSDEDRARYADYERGRLLAAKTTDIENERLRTEKELNAAAEKRRRDELQQIQNAKFGYIYNIPEPTRSETFNKLSVGDKNDYQAFIKQYKNEPFDYVPQPTNSQPKTLLLAPPEVPPIAPAATQKEAAEKAQNERGQDSAFRNAFKYPGSAFRFIDPFTKKSKTVQYDPKEKSHTIENVGI